LSFQKPQLKYVKKFPKLTRAEIQRSLLIFDQILLKVPKAQSWISQFPFQYGVASGESLKDLRNFPSHIETILTRAEEIPERPLQIICVGGGSVGDFAGFVASIFKRGVEFTQVPSTWLAAIDSAHGGKNALNVGSIKNQIGTFYFPQNIWLIQELLEGQPPERVEDALGEALKIALIQGGTLWAKWQKIKTWNAQSLWKLLPEMVDGKYKVVQKDPYEKKGIRHVLNLGHTVGHIFEAELKVSHGLAVLAGLGFALEWSRQLKILKDPELLKIPYLQNHKDWLRKIKNPEKYLKQDKKRVGGGKVRFIFLQKPGKTVIQAVEVADIVSEMKRQAP
jgi:3-dehydroquinate synthase